MDTFFMTKDMIDICEKKIEIVIREIDSLVECFRVLYALLSQVCD